MTRTAYARLAGFLFLFYIATAIAGSVLFARASGSDTLAVAERLARIAQHAGDVRLSVFFTIVTILDALALGVALFAITREADPDLAVLALSCRVAEGVLNAVLAIVPMALLSLTTAKAAPDLSLAGLLLESRTWLTAVGATIFAVGSTIFAYLFLRARSIPVWLSWLGIVASLLLAVGVPAEMLGVLEGPLTAIMWLPILAFELTLGVWLLVKGVRPTALLDEIRRGSEEIERGQGVDQEEAARRLAKWLGK